MRSATRTTPGLTKVYTYDTKDPPIPRRDQARMGIEITDSYDVMSTIMHQTTKRARQCEVMTLLCNDIAEEWGAFCALHQPAAASVSTTHAHEFPKQENIFKSKLLSKAFKGKLQRYQLGVYSTKARPTVISSPTVPGTQISLSCL